jgi:NitT/TauT family transport system ATP-binding protein
MQSRNKVALVGVSHWFGGDRATSRLILDDISLDVQESEFVAIVGASGAGKTTMLDMIAGLTAPDEGSVLIDGDPVRDVNNGKIAYMFAKDTLLPWRTALANVELALEIRRTGGRAEARQLLGKVGLSDFAEYFPSQLSQGMRQRVALARTLAVDAPVWLLDEPFGALDASTRTLMQAEFVRIWEAERKTAVFVTHDLSEAIMLGDRVVVVDSAPGRVKASYEVRLPRPRDVLDLHSSEEYLRLYRTLWSDLRESLEARATSWTR